MEFHLDISSELINIKKVRSFLEDVFMKLNLEKVHFNRIFLCLSEAVNNAIVHGNQCVSCRNVSISVSYTNNFLTIEISDEGTGFNIELVKDPTLSENLKKESGRGIFLMKNICDDVLFLDEGRRVQIKYMINK